jgi:hypothetical protein
MAQRDPVATGMELLAMEVGFRALWVDDTKRPYPNLTPHGVKDATCDPRVLQEWSWVVPDSALGVVLPDGLVCIDRDDRTKIVEGVPKGTWGEQTRRGDHHLVMLPLPRVGRSKLPDGAGDLIAGPAAYVVLAPSRDRWSFDLDAPVLPLAPDSALWRTTAMAREQRRQRQMLARTTAAESQVGRDVDIATLLAQLKNGAFVETVDLLVEGRWSERYRSRSEADFALAFMATHFTRDRDLLQALLAQQSEKAHEHANPSEYIALTAASALDARVRADQERLQRLRSLLIGEDEPRSVYGVTQGDDLPDLREAIVLFAASSKVDEFARGEGWRRLPVEDLAALYGVHRQTVWRHLRAVADSGQIAYASVRARSDKGTRTDSLVRSSRSLPGHLVPACERASRDPTRRALQTEGARDPGRQGSASALGLV